MRQRELVRLVNAGELVSHTRLAEFDPVERANVENELLQTTTGRRWLRDDPALSSQRADRLLTFSADFQTARRDRTLASVIKHASLAAIEHHIEAIAAGPAASALWQRLAEDPAHLVTVAAAVVARAPERVAEATLHLLVLDPLNEFEVAPDDQVSIAIQALSSVSSRVRGLAVEYLAANAPAAVHQSFDQLVTDASERVRGIAWDVALLVEPAATVERATLLLGDETVPVPIRRSALQSLGARLSTRQIADLLTFLVIHPDHDLALDAAELLYQHHRNPVTATAARDSPHADVREIAERLLDPRRGSPAAGGSRPGDPTRSSADIYADMLRQLDAKTENRTDEPQR